MTRKKDLEKIIEHYGGINQVLVLFEEMGELTKAITKVLREQGNKADVAEELADVQIMIDQMKLIFKLSEKTMNEFVNYKIDRTLERIENAADGVPGE